LLPGCGEDGAAVLVEEQGDHLGGRPDVEPAAARVAGLREEGRPAGDAGPGHRQRARLPRTPSRRRAAPAVSPLLSPPGTRRSRMPTRPSTTTCRTSAPLAA